VLFKNFSDDTVVDLLARFRKRSKRFKGHPWLGNSNTYKSSLLPGVKFRFTAPSWLALKSISSMFLLSFEKNNNSNTGHLSFAVDFSSIITFIVEGLNSGLFSRRKIRIRFPG
jgi:hypothetical protein